jgi:copper chaperone CopZ
MNAMRKQRDMVVQLTVHDMHCGGCEATVYRAISRLPGVRRIKVSSRKTFARVTVDPESATTLTDLIDAVNATGYRAEPQTHR